MTPFSSKAFRRVSILAVVMVYLLTIMGGLVRTTGSGLGCPDWPLCYGHLIPPPDIHAIIEYSHRAVAFFASLSLIALTVMAFMRHRRDLRIAGPTALMAGLLVIQVPLGGVVVASELTPYLVAMHLGLAILILGCVVDVAVAAHSPARSDGAVGPSRPRLVRTLIPITLVGLFLLVLAGALVVGSDATFACPGWPLCSGTSGLLPSGSDSQLQAIQLLHRYLVGVVSILVIALIAAIMRGNDRGLRRWAWWLGGLFVGQILVGALQVWTLFPTALRVLHLAMAAAVWSSLVALAAYAALNPASERVVGEPIIQSAK